MHKIDYFYLDLESATHSQHIYINLIANIPRKQSLLIQQTKFIL